jgi:hypothetical protein
MFREHLYRVADFLNLPGPVCGRIPRAPAATSRRFRRVRAALLIS